MSNKKPYVSKDGKKRNQGSFVGFFPAENPIYSAIVVVYSGLSEKAYYGGTRPAEAFREVVDGIYAMNPAWREVIDREESSGNEPEAQYGGQKRPGNHTRRDGTGAE